MANTSMKIPKFQFLDSIRGFLAFTVALQHFAQMNASLGTSPWDFMNTLAAIIGVVGFFILSSFLLTYRLLSEYLAILNKTDKTNYGKIMLLISSTIKFAIRRVARIYPLYVTLVFAVKYGPWSTDTTYRGLPNNFWDILYIINSYPNITWTIRVEMTYYLFIPFICLFTSLCYKRFRVLPVVTLVALCIYCDSHWTVEKCGGNPYCFYFRFRGWLSAFVSGSLVAIVYYWVEDYAQSILNTNVPCPNHEQVHGRNIFETLLSSRIINVLNFFSYFMSFVFLLLLNKHLTLLSLVNVDYDKLVLFNYPAYHWCLVLFLALLSRGSFANLFNNRFWNHAGQISFGIYLTHMIWLINLYKMMPAKLFRGFEGFAVYIFFIMLSSTVTYHLIEYPGMWIGTELCRVVDQFFDATVFKKI